MNLSKKSGKRGAMKTALLLLFLLLIGCGGQEIRDRSHEISLDDFDQLYERFRAITGLPERSKSGTTNKVLINGILYVEDIDLDPKGPVLKPYASFYQLEAMVDWMEKEKDNYDSIEELIDRAGKRHLFVDGWIN